MAVPSTYIVKSGDCLWTIAEKYLGSGNRWGEIADLNGISRSNATIYTGQELRLTVQPATPEQTVKTTSSSKSSNVVTINYFGLTAGSQSELYVAWSWDKSNTKNFMVRWYYKNNEGVEFLGTDTTTENYIKSSKYSAPQDAISCSVYIKPISTTYKSNNKDVNYWTAAWSTAKTWYFSSNPPENPSTPTVELDNFKLTARVDNLDELSKKIDFQIVKDDSTIFNTGSATVSTLSASYSCTVTAGGKYKVRCRAENNGKYSDWSPYSSNVTPVPNAPTDITSLKALSSTSIYIEWSSVSSSDSYTIEYTTNIDYFDSSSSVSSMSVDAPTHHSEIIGLESGEEYFFRVNAVNDEGESSWTAIKSVKIGKAPSAPTTWSSNTSVIVGDPLVLYWVHNSEDNSRATFAEIEIDINGVVETHTITYDSTQDEDDPEPTYNYVFDTSLYREGVVIKWRVRTAGITSTYGDWSVQRVVNLYSPPTLQLGIYNHNDDMLDIIEHFPFYIKAIPGPSTQVPVSYYVSVISTETYETIDNIGNSIIISAGDSIYSKYFDTNQHLLVEMSADNIDLENNITYNVVCTVSMDSGLVAEESVSFTVSWIETRYAPNAEISIDPDSMVAYIKPYCEYYEYEYYEVEYRVLELPEDEILETYVKTDNRLPSTTDGLTINGAVTTTGELVFETEDDVLFCLVIPDEGELAENVKLSVYRREYDGRFIEIGKDLLNIEETFITDPHPSLDYARYRVIAIDIDTGAVSFFDVPGYPILEKSIIIQWDEKWSEFESYGEDLMEQPPWSGSLLKLPYNVDVSNDYNIDVSLIEYVGRENPVSYYGTQRGETATWNVDIDKKDVDTLYALRRLAIWMGDVYVREPSGSGYWANINVSFSQKHKDTVIPVTLNIKRVEGGV